MQTLFSARPAWAEINLDHLAHNVRQFKELIDPDTRLMAVVKADGYGHGAVEAAKTALAGGACSLAVAIVEEGIELRRSGIEAPILVFGYTAPSLFPALVEHNLTPTIFSLDSAVQLSKQAGEQNIILPLHVKVDTGMGRLGLLPEEAVETIARIVRLPGLKVEGLYTHLAAAEEEDPSYTNEQLVLFDRIVECCREKGVTIPIIHAANSAAGIAHPHARYNLVRLGLAMYGCYPSPHLRDSRVVLLPALAFKSRVVLVKRVPPGTAISYGCTYYTDDEALIATIPVGYGDGYSRLLSNRGQILVRGQRAPVVGRVCMDHLMADVSHIPGVHEGDEVVLYGRQGREEIEVDEVAALTGTISYEVLCAVAKRVPRLYFRNGCLAAIRDFINDYRI